MKNKRKWCVGVDVGGTKIAAGLVDGAGRILAREKMGTPQNASPDQIAKGVVKVIEKTLEAGRIDPKQLKGIGVGIPGVVKPDQKGILITPNINLSKYPLAKKLESRFKVAVRLGNDVNLGLLGEYWLGAGRNKKNLIGIFPGTGVGGGIILDGKLFTGAQGAAGELGHMILDYNSLEQNAGVYGSLEALASRRAIERNIHKAVKKGEKTMITGMVNGKSKLIKSKVLAAALKKRDPLVVKIMQEFCTVLGKACISLRHIFNPEMIILGGGVIEACGDYILPRVKKNSESDPFFKGIDRCQIVPSQLGDDAVILGAVALFNS